jgi:hypothetical protein
VQDSMENCPDSDGENMLYLVLSAFLWPVLFSVLILLGRVVQGTKKKKLSSKNDTLKDEEFRDLQVELYGDRVLELQNTRHSKASSNKSASRSSHGPERNV